MTELNSIYDYGCMLCLKRLCIITSFVPVCFFKPIIQNAIIEVQNVKAGRHAFEQLGIKFQGNKHQTKQLQKYSGLKHVGNENFTFLLV